MILSTKILLQLGVERIVYAIAMQKNREDTTQSVLIEERT